MTLSYSPTDSRTWILFLHFATQSVTRSYSRPNVKKRARSFRRGHRHNMPFLGGIERILAVTRHVSYSRKSRTSALTRRHPDKTKRCLFRQFIIVMCNMIILLLKCNANVDYHWKRTLTAAATDSHRRRNATRRSGII